MNGMIASNDQRDIILLGLNFGPPTNAYGGNKTNIRFARWLLG